MSTERVTISVPSYDGTSVCLDDVLGGELYVAVAAGEVTISGDAGGLRHLARWCLALSSAVPGCHVHLDAGVDLDDGSAPLVVELIASATSS